MAIDLVSLALISLVSVACPIIAGLIPGKPIPETVLLLLAGALLGPHGLGAIQSTDAINLLSDLGLAFLFLLAGYEISPKNLTGTEGKRGAATWAVTFAIAFVVVAIWPTLSAFELDGLAVVIALTTTAMGTLLPILQERGILGTRMGNEIIAYGTWASCFPSSPWRFCSRPGPPGRPWSSSSRSSPSPWRPPPCRRSPSASAAMCTGSSSPMPTPTRRWSSVR